MKYSALLVLVSGASSALGSTVQDVLSDITTINTNVMGLTSSLNGFNGEISSAVPVTGAESTLQKSLNQGTSDAKGVSDVSESDGNTVLQAVNSLLPNVIDSLNVFVGKAPMFQSAGLGQVASSDILMLQTGSNNFANALVSVAPTGISAQATAARDCIQAAFSSAIAGSSASSCKMSAATAVPAAGGSSGSSSSANSATSAAASSATSHSGSMSATTTSRLASATSAAASAATSHAGSSSGSSSLYTRYVFPSQFCGNLLTFLVPLESLVSSLQPPLPSLYEVPSKKVASRFCFG